MANRKISYTTRDFQGIRTELLNYVKTYYPELIQDFNDASVFSVFIDLNAAVADNLNYQIDRSVQETVLQYAQQRSSIYNIARTYGLKLPGQRPSVALVDFSITVPAYGDKEDERYLGILTRGSQITGAGIVFENIYDIDFSSPYNAQGFPNRLKIPNFNANNVLVNYTITKRELVVNGITKVFKKVISPNDVVPFFELFLPEKNVLGITSVLLKSGTEYTNIPSAAEFLGVANRWYEVDALAEDRVFVEDPTKVSDQPGIKVGKYIQTQNRFISEYTAEGFKKMTFGGGTNTAQDALDQFTTVGATLDLQRYSNNFSLGSTLAPNSTLFIQYRVGGGLATNLGTNVINQIGTISFYVNGPSESTNSSVVNSLRANNVTAAVGGAGVPSLEEIRNYVSFNFSAQKRAVTVQDYESIIRNMPSQFGAPAKVSITENDNKILIQLLSYDTSGKLTNVVSNTLRQNVANYLSNYRMMNDYISILTAEVIDLSVEVSIVLDSAQNSGQIISNVIDKVSTYFDPQIRQLGQNVYLSELSSIIQNQNGVLTVANINIYNMVGGQYSSAQTSMEYLDPETKQIATVDDTIFAQPSQVYQIRFPNKDIKISVKNFQSVTFT
jgi:Baseplate J-like protein